MKPVEAGGVVGGVVLGGVVFGGVVVVALGPNLTALPPIAEELLTIDAFPVTVPDCGLTVTTGVVAACTTNKITVPITAKETANTAVFIFFDLGSFGICILRTILLNYNRFFTNCLYYSLCTDNSIPDMLRWQRRTAVITHC